MQSVKRINTSLEWMHDYFKKGMETSLDNIIKAKDDKKNKEIFENTYFDCKKGLEIIEHLQYEFNKIK